MAGVARRLSGDPGTVRAAQAIERVADGQLTPMVTTA
jgi:hypothetical protein